MSAASNYLEDAVLNHVLRNASLAQPTSLKLGLFTSVSGLEENSPTGEVSGNGYAREDVTFGTASGGQATTDATVTFPTASGGAWGTITHVAVMDESSNVLFYGGVTTSKTIEDGDTFQVSAGNLTINLD